MAIEKYIIDKSELTALLKGEDLAIQPKGNIRGFCLEIAGNVTNGDMIKAMLNPYKVCEYEYSVHVYLTEEDFWKADYIINCSTNWWNAPYKVDKKYRTKVITRGNCMMCGKELTEGLFFCKKCENNIKALNQEPILDKIRAEIEQNAYPIVHGVNNHEKGMTVYGILQIIDKYKKESESEEWYKAESEDKE